MWKEENIIISSKYMRQLLPFHSANMLSITLWKIAGALVKPKGILINSKCPPLARNAVLSEPDGSTS